MHFKNAAPILLLAMSFLSCAEKKGPRQAASEPIQALGSDFVSADAQGVKISEVLNRIKGRWLQKVSDPRQPDINALQWRAVRDNTLEGRFLLGGAYADSGVAASLIQEGDVYTLTLVDDEVRPHGYIPPERIFKGTYDAEKRELTFKTDTGAEWIAFKYVKAPVEEDPEEGDYQLLYSSHISRCVPVIAPPDPSPSPSPNPLTLAAAPSVPRSQVLACGRTLSFEERWTRVSGAY